MTQHSGGSSESSPESSRESSPAETTPAAAPPENAQWQTPTPWQAGLKARCPRCGKGRLFKQVLNLRDNCECCGLD